MWTIIGIVPVYGLRESSGMQLLGRTTLLLLTTNLPHRVKLQYVQQHLDAHVDVQRVSLSTKFMVELHKLFDYLW